LLCVNLHLKKALNAKYYDFLSLGYEEGFIVS